MPATEPSHSKFDLTGKTALITGGGRGIGLQIALTLQRAGANIILSDADESRLPQAAQRFPVKPQVHQLDVTDAKAVRELAGRIVDCPDILVNNAGVSRAAPTRDTTDEDWRTVLSVNLDGVFYCSRTFGSLMAERGSGAIVNISSMCGEIVTRQQSVVTAYNASKAGVNMVTKTLACEWARSGVRVNAVAPGFVRSDMTDKYPKEVITAWSNQTPMGRFAEPEEIASAVQFLASDASSYMTGTILLVDGGYTCW
ncbi:3-oxoacyl-ACP reductase [Mesorhizobium sp. SARCC-RB16n]|uniref:SDR family NAD(P)-dependent oxidoreductase n=1 Tax=Mesorhizobium sp. SARCC-RB16n TaxID=2116687 RepID=UPI00122F715D|nr:SDR family NAD(P)-dependent oxidoreductase [Mesorhizobium sp. SARCC-RB16n]KAA3447945.1 3-oxoacyl-ACP reductase [Mesorhizobium sp. SARCC-RB16n]